MTPYLNLCIAELFNTRTFTAQLGAALAFAILVTVLVDIAVQMNVWWVVGVSGLSRLGRAAGPLVAPDLDDDAAIHPALTHGHMPG